MRAIHWLVLGLFGFFVAAGPVWSAGKQTLEIASQSGVHVFSVELADNDAERVKGTHVPQGTARRAGHAV